MSDGKMGCMQISEKYVHSGKPNSYFFFLARHRNALSSKTFQIECSIRYFIKNNSFYVKSGSLTGTQFP